MGKTKMGFVAAARFNAVMDNSQRLNDGLLELTKRYGSLTEQEYIQEMLGLFREAGLDLTADELNTLLMLRMKTDQMLLKEKAKQMQGGRDK